MDETEEVIKKAINKIEKIKDIIRKQTGSYKYDDCYDDCIRVLKNLSNEKLKGKEL